MTEAALMVPGPADKPTVGSLIAGKYRLELLIGEGGQAWIWKARHLELESEVALKILRFNTEDTTQSERLRTEARAVAKLNNPAIVRVFDLGQTQHGNPYFAMEHLDGENLADLLARTGRLPAVEAVRTLLPIAGAVAAAHAIGVVHRDLKPDNVFLAHAQHFVQPKLLDFGVAKHQVHLSRSMNLTEVGAVLGSPSYLSPEQARGQADVDTRADIWSFCAMLYECVTGKVPFSADNTHALLFSIAEDDPLSLAERGVEEPELWEILRRGLEKSAAARWPNMRSLGRALAQWLIDRAVTSDITGVMLESIWLNPEIVTPPPTPSTAADLEQWQERRVVASHIESLAPVRSLHRGRVVWSMALFTSLGTAFGFLVATQGPFNSATDAVAFAPTLRPFGPAPQRLRVARIAHTVQAMKPSVFDALIPAVPVEKLELVASPSADGTREQARQRGNHPKLSPASPHTAAASSSPSNLVTEALPPVAL
ncbi:MAG TPA: serine/threonine-protein kinase [Polyangiaceae bacterium]|nr:serine/threonine-protein kinase [Polyangiaceae bacterium]